MEQFEKFQCRLCGRTLPISKISPPFWEPTVEKPVCIDCFNTRPEFDLARKIKQTLEEALSRIKSEKRKRR